MQFKYLILTAACAAVLLAVNAQVRADAELSYVYQSVECSYYNYDPVNGGTFVSDADDNLNGAWPHGEAILWVPTNYTAQAIAETDVPDKYTTISPDASMTLKIKGQTHVSGNGSTGSSFGLSYGLTLTSDYDYACTGELDAGTSGSASGYTRIRLRQQQPDYTYVTIFEDEIETGTSTIDYSGTLAGGYYYLLEASAYYTSNSISDIGFGHLGTDGVDFSLGALSAPEPASLALLAVGGTLLMPRRKRA